MPQLYNVIKWDNSSTSAKNTHHNLKITVMEITTINKNLRLVKHNYIANNRLCIDYAALYTKNGEERFCGYYHSIPTIDEIDYEQLHKHYEQNAQMPSWIKE